MTPAVIVAGIENAVAATVVLPQPDVLYLAHEFMLLGERWFPNWRTDPREDEDPTSDERCGQEEAVGLDESSLGCEEETCLARYLTVEQWCSCQRV